MKMDLISKYFLGFVMSRKDAKAAANRYDESMKFQLEQLCDALCVTEWSQWSLCSRT